MVVALAFASSATAGPYAISGDVKPRHLAWLQEASARVPVPKTSFKLISGYNPAYFPDLRVMLLPRPGHGGWTYRTERATFFHELGHVFDHEALAPGDRMRFRSLVGTECRWRQRPCRSESRWNGQGLDLAPNEMFAEAYAACALGLTRHEIHEAGVLPSYGWEPPPGSDQQLCAFLRDLDV